MKLRQVEVTAALLVSYYVTDRTRQDCKLSPGFLANPLTPGLLGRLCRRDLVRLDSNGKQ